MNHDNLSDEQLAQLSMQNQDYFEALILRHQKALVCFLSKHLLLSRENAEDIAQEALIKAYFNLYRFAQRPGCTWKTWLYKIALNTGKSWLRKMKHQQIFYEIPEIHDSQDYALCFDKQELAVKLKVMVLSLKPIQQQLVQMYFYQGLSFKEISRELKIPVRKLNIVMRQAIKNLTVLFYS